MRLRVGRGRVRAPSLRALAGVAILAVPLVTARVRAGRRGGSRDSVTSGRMAVEDRKRAESEKDRKDDARKDGAGRGGRKGDGRQLPGKQAAVETLERMLLIRRFEERAGEMYAKAKIGGFLHLSIGEEAAIVGAIDAMRERDYLISTYREHGQALARGTHPNSVMAELFGRVDGCSKGRGGSMHLFDAERRFLGGYGIVGANLPLAVGVGLACDYLETDDACVCMMGDGASNQGTFGESMNLAALWDLPVVFYVVNNQFGMGTKLERHSAVTDLSRKSAGFGVPGVQCDGMDVLEVHAAVSEALKKARDDREPQLVEAVTYRYRGHSMADPEEYRTKEEVEEWRKRDPIETFRKRLADEDVLSDEEFQKLDEEVGKRIDEATEFADQSPFPDLDSLYDDIYVYGEQVRGWYSVDERSPEVHRGEREREAGEVPRKLAEAGAAYAGVGDAKARRRREDGGDEGESGEGQGEAAADEREEEGGAD